MKIHTVKTQKAAGGLPREEELAWKIAAAAADDVPVEADVAEMIGNRIIDDTAVAVASLARRPVVNARAQAVAHPMRPGACIYELWSELGDEADQAARWSGVSESATPSVNLTPSTTLGN